MKYPHESRNLNRLFDVAEYYYKRQPFKLDYHNFKHARYVFEKLNEIGGLNPVTALAAIYHDVVYFTRANNGVCEGASAALLGQAARNLDSIYPFDEFEKSVVNKAQSVIEMTDIETHLQFTYEMLNHPDSNFVLDADLASLAEPYDVFCKNQISIIMENLGDPTKQEMKLAVADFLHRFLHRRRKTIYRTQKAIELWEDQARENILRWSKNCGYEIPKKKQFVL